MSTSDVVFIIICAVLISACSLCRIGRKFSLSRSHRMHKAKLATKSPSRDQNNLSNIHVYGSVDVEQIDDYVTTTTPSNTGQAIAETPTFLVQQEIHENDAISPLRHRFLSIQHHTESYSPVVTKFQAPSLNYLDESAIDDYERSPSNLP